MVNIFGHSSKSSAGHLGVDISSKSLSFPNAPAINQEVEAAAEKYENMEQKLDTLIQAMKDQHVTTKHANLKKLETIKIFEDFVKGTPLEQVVGPVNVNMETPQEIESKVPDMSQGGVPKVSKMSSEKEANEKSENLEDAVPGLVEDNTFDSDSSSSSEDSAKAKKKASPSTEDNEYSDEDDEDIQENDGEQETEKNQDENETHEDDGDENDGDEKGTGKKLKDAATNAKDKMKEKVKKPFAKMSEASDEVKDKMKEAKDDMKETGQNVKEAMKKPFEDTEKKEAEKRKEKYGGIAETMAHPFEPLDNIEHKTSMDDPNYSDIGKNVYVETSLILDDYVDQIMHYLQSWKKINKTRIKAGLYEFKEMCEKLEHYQSKMNNMDQDKVDQEKYERNQQKLLGILEAHTTYSEKLLRYIEEVTERGWKDFYPLLLNAMEFDLSYASAQYKYSAHLKSVVKHLKKKVGKEYDLQQQGRLQELESNPLGDVYTGDRTSPKPSYLVAYPGKKGEKQ